MLFFSKYTKNQVSTPININSILFDIAAEFEVYNSGHILDCNQPDIEDGVADENQDGEAVAMIEESPSGVCQILQLLMLFL